MWDEVSSDTNQSVLNSRVNKSDTWLLLLPDTCKTCDSYITARVSCILVQTEEPNNFCLCVCRSQKKACDKFKKLHTDCDAYYMKHESVHTLMNSKINATPPDEILPTDFSDKAYESITQSYVSWAILKGLKGHDFALRALWYSEWCCEWISHTDQFRYKSKHLIP